ncbi:hypothetical protein BC829DRAFT_393769, partial [Chytridium lagenaria]
RPLINRWKTLSLPWRSQKFVGYDLVGNMYFEGPAKKQGAIATRRTIEYADGRTEIWSYSGKELPIQWQAWLRHTRADPPTLEEIVEAEAQREAIITKARELNRLRGETESGQVPVQPAIAAKATEAKPTGQGESFQPGSWSPIASKKRGE